MRSSLETPFTFFQIERKRFFLNPIEATQLPCGLIPEIFNAINVFAMLNERRGMIHTHMVKTRDIQGIGTGQGIGLDRCYRAQSFC